MVNLSSETAQGTKYLWSLKTGSVITHINYCEKFTLGIYKGDLLTQTVFGTDAVLVSFAYIHI